MYGFDLSVALESSSRVAETIQYHCAEFHKKQAKRSMDLKAWKRNDPVVPLRCLAP